MARQILVPVDGSPKSMEGLEHALTTYPDADVTVLTVMSPGEARGEDDRPLSQDQLSEWYDEARVATEDVLEEARALAADRDAEIATAVDVGEPWRSIVEYAERNDVDHIVMGSHGRSDDSPLLLGSVAETVVRRAPVLVTVVR